MYEKVVVEIDCNIFHITVLSIKISFNTRGKTSIKTSIIYGTSTKMSMEILAQCLWFVNLFTQLRVDYTFNEDPIVWWFVVIIGITNIDSMNPSIYTDVARIHELKLFVKYIWLQRRLPERITIADVSYAEYEQLLMGERGDDDWSCVLFSACGLSVLNDVLILWRQHFGRHFRCSLVVRRQ